MSRLIDADALKDRFNRDFFGYGQLVEMIETAPTVDAAPVVRGKWVRETEYDMECSECAMCWRHADNETHKFDYCPNCGAKMEQ